jgi:YggT family protein
MAGLAYILNMVLEIYLWIVIIRAVLSWVRPSPFNPVVRIIYNLVDPATYKISRIIPTRIGMFDIAPLILIFAVMVVQRYILRLLFAAAAGF